MAITTQLVGKLGGGLSWTKVTGAQKSIAYDTNNKVLASVTLGVGNQYLLAMKYTYVSGNPADCYFQIGELSSRGTFMNWGMTGPGNITAGTRQHPLMVSRPFASTGIAEIWFTPAYQSGTHVLSADLYYAEMPTL